MITKPRISRRQFHGLLGLALAAMALGARGAMAAKDTPNVVKLDYAYYNPVSLLLKEKGWLEKELAKDNIKVEWVLSSGSNKALEYLASRSLDFGSTAGSAAFVAKANGNPIRSIYVYSKPEWTALVVKKGSLIKDVDDLKGKRVAANKGTDPYIFLLRALDQKGVKARDLEIIQLSHADGRLALEKGDVSVWAGLDPLMAKTELESGSKVIYRNPSFNTYGILNVRDEFARKYPDQVLSVLSTYEKARLYSLQNPKELKKILVQEAKVTPAVANRQLSRTDLRNSAIGPTQKATIAAAAEVLKKNNVIPSSTNTNAVLGSLIDTSFGTKLSKAKAGS